MKKEELTELLKYCSPNSIYVVRYDNRIVEVICPFEVIALNNVNKLSTGKTYIVDGIRLSSDLRVVYVINDLRGAFKKKKSRLELEPAYIKGSE